MPKSTPQTRAALSRSKSIPYRPSLVSPECVIEAIAWLEQEGNFQHWCENSTEATRQMQKDIQSLSGFRNATVSQRLKRMFGNYKNLIHRYKSANNVPPNTPCGNDGPPFERIHNLVSSSGGERPLVNQNGVTETPDLLETFASLFGNNNNSEDSSSQTPPPQSITQDPPQNGLHSPSPPSRSGSVLLCDPNDNDSLTRMPSIAEQRMQILSLRDIETRREEVQMHREETRSLINIIQQQQSQIAEQTRLMSQQSSELLDKLYNILERQAEQHHSLLETISKRPPSY